MAYSPTNCVPDRGTARIVYILSKGNTTNQFSLPQPEAELSAGAGLVCVSYSQYLFLPLAIVSECAGKLTACLSRAAEGPTVNTTGKKNGTREFTMISAYKEYRNVRSHAAHLQKYSGYVSSFMLVG